MPYKRVYNKTLKDLVSCIPLEAYDGINGEK